MAGLLAALVDWSFLPALAPFALVLAIAVSTVLLFVLGRRTRGAFGALLMVEAGYFALAFVARPLVLLMAEPRPRMDDPIADTRLYRLGYDDGLMLVLWAVAVGVVTYLVASVVARRWASPRDGGLQLRVAPLVALLTVGWIFRLLSHSAPENGLLSTLAIVGSVAIGLLVLFSARLRAWPLAAAVGSELLWSILTETKAPVMSLVLWLVIRLVVRGGRVSWRTWLPLGSVAAIGFVAIQELRVRSGRLTASNVWEEGYPAWMRPALPLLARFDLLFATTDAVAAGQGRWLSPGEWVERFLAGLLPQQLVGAKQLAGELWGTQVRSLSLPGRPGANLADGPIGEGYIMAGHLGVVLEVAVVVALTLLIARMLQSRSLVAIAFGVGMTSQPFLFERGLLGISEGAGKSFQVALIVLVLLWLAVGLFGPVRQPPDQLTERTATSSHAAAPAVSP